LKTKISSSIGKKQIYVVYFNVAVVVANYVVVGLAPYVREYKLIYNIVHSFILLNIVYWALFGDHDLW
jgi:hypothetical protein